MSESAKVNIVRQYINKIDNNDVDGSHQLVTDNFVYIVDPKPTGLKSGNMPESGYDKAGYKKFHETITQHTSGFKTVIDNISESGNKVSVRAKTSFQYQKDNKLVTNDSPWTADFEFSGDKICSVKAVQDANFTH